MDRIDEDHRIHRVEWPVLPLDHALDDLVGDGGDGLPRHLGAIDLRQMRGDLTGRQTLGGQRDHHLVHTAQTPLPLRDDPGLEAGIAVAWHVDLDRADIGEHGLGPGAVTRVTGPAAGRIVLVIAEVIGHLALERGLQQPLGQLLQHPALTGQLQPAGLGAAQQLRDELLIQAGCGLRVLGVLHAGHHVGHQVHFHDRELHRSFYSPLFTLLRSCPYPS